MHRAARILVLLLTLGAAGAGSVWLASRAADAIEARSSEAVGAALKGAGFSWAGLTVDGLIVRLGGEAPDEVSRLRAVTVAGQIVRPEYLRDEITVRAPDSGPPPAFQLEVLRHDADVTVHGLIPGGVSEQQKLIAGISKTGRGLAISDLLSATQTDAPDGWPEAIALGLQALGMLNNGRVVVTPHSLTVTGLTASEAQTGQLESRLKQAAPADLNLVLELRTPRPVVSPFIARFRLDHSGAAVEACTAGSPAGVDRLATAATIAGFDTIEPCTIALGVPDPNWESVVALGLEALGKIGSGRLTVSDLSITLSASDDVLADDLTRVATQLEADVPEIYTLNVPQRTTEPAALPVGRVNFTAIRTPEGTVEISGPLPDQRSISIVQSLARSQTEAVNLALALRQQAGLPEGWALRVLTGLEAFASLETGALKVTPTLIDLQGATGSTKGAATIAANLAAALGPSGQFNLDVAYDASLDPLAALPTPAECIAQITAIQAKTKITFDPGATELNAAASKIVRRIADVLRKCPDAEVEIGGHTDSQGRDEMNQKLSQARAGAVAGALIAARIDPARLTSKGYGEAEPVASNSDAEGREANRRIEIRLSGTAATPTAEAPVTPDAEPDEPTAAEDDVVPTPQERPESTDGQD